MSKQQGKAGSAEEVKQYQDLLKEAKALHDKEISELKQNVTFYENKLKEAKQAHDQLQKEIGSLKSKPAQKPKQDDIVTEIEGKPKADVKELQKLKEQVKQL